MIDRFHSLDRRTWVVVLAVAFVVLRALVASVSGFGFHQGWNEGHYALIASGFLEHPLVPNYGDLYVYNVPPLFPYAVAGSFALFGESVLAARLPSVLATGGLIVVTYELGREVFDDRTTAATGAVVLATLPYVQLFGGRVQTDATVVFLVTASVTAILRGYTRETEYRRWLVIGAALFVAAVATKQPALGVAGVVLFWLMGNRRFDAATVRRTGTLIGASALCFLPLLAWFYLNYLNAPTAFVTDWEHELFTRTPPFANVRLLVAIGLGLGVTPPVLAAAAVGLGVNLRDAVDRYRTAMRTVPGPSILAWWLLLFGVFVFVRTPHGHQYYALVLAPPIALYAGHGLTEMAARLDGIRGHGRETVHGAVLVMVLVATLGGTVVLYELSGEYSVANGGGTQVAADAGGFVATEIPDDSTVLVSNGYAPPVKWYVRGEFPVENVESYHVGELSEDRLRATASGSEGPVYLVYPQPAWSDLPTVDVTEVYETRSYEFTIMDAVAKYAETDSKFTFYLEDRRLVVYRVDS